MRMVLIISLSLLVATSIPAQARAAGDDDPLAAFGLHVVKPMTSDQISATRARVDAELLRDRAFEIFKDTTNPNGGLVADKVSGLTCPLGLAGQSVRVIDDNSVICRSHEGDSSFETSVTRAPDSSTLQMIFEGAVQRARQEPNYAPFQGISMEGHPKSGSDLPDHRTIRYTSRVDDRIQFTRLQVGLVRGWLLAESKVGPLPKGSQPDMGEFLSEANFGSNLAMPPSP